MASDFGTSVAAPKVKKFVEYPDIWATALALNNGSLHEEGLSKIVRAPTERHLLVLGGKAVGKTTLISRYLDRKTDDKETVGVSYSSLRRQRDDSSQLTDVGNIWEIGASAFIKEMFDIIISDQSDRRDIMVFIVVDISRPETIFGVLENTLLAVSGAIKSFPEVTVWIVGNKFDRQQNLNLEFDKRQAIVDVLHQLAATFSYGLIYANHQNHIDPRIKNILDSWFAGENIPEYPVVNDALKLVYIPPVVGRVRPLLTKEDIDRGRLTLNTTIPQKAAVEFRPVKDTTDTKLYAEAELDEAFALISAELKTKTRLIQQSKN